MSRHNFDLMQHYRSALSRYETDHSLLPGISNPQHRDVLIQQIIDSVRRIEYVHAISSQAISPLRADPQNESLFDPLRAALIHRNLGNIDEACWLIFLFTHFGKHRHAKWRYAREVYGKLGKAPHWTWLEVSKHPHQFRNWLRDNATLLLRGSNRGFGNHRKYTSMDADKPTGTGRAVETYVAWVTAHGGHEQLFQTALINSQMDSKRAFAWLYRSMDTVSSFARTGKFDYLTMIGKTGLAAIEPGLAYLANSTGPRQGARVLFGKTTPSITEQERRLVLLAAYLNVGMQVIEDSLCNWHKNPGTYIYFSG